MFAARIKQLRKEKGMTQVELAKALGISKGTVAMWETGKRKPSFEMLNNLCDFFDRRLDYILGTSDDTRSPKLTEEDIEQITTWTIEENYEEMLFKYTLLDDYGKALIDYILQAEFNRCHEQGTLYSDFDVSISVRLKTVKKN